MMNRFSFVKRCRLALWSALSLCGVSSVFAVNYTGTIPSGTNMWDAVTWTGGTPFVDAADNNLTLSATAGESYMTINKGLLANTMTLQGNVALTLFSGFGQTLTTINASGYTGALTINFALAGANITAGADTILMRSSTGTLTIPANQKATIMETWGGTLAQTGTLVYGGRHSYARNINVTGERVVDFTGEVTITGGNMLNVDTGTINIRDGANIKPSRFRSNDTANATTAVINHMGGTVDMTTMGTEPANGSGNVYPYNNRANNQGIGNPLFGHWQGTTTYNLSGGLFNAENRYVELGFMATVTFNQSGGTFKVKALTAQTNMGTYNLTGGTLELEERIDLPETGRINLGAGTVKATGPFRFAQAVTLTDPQVGTVIDPAEQNLSLGNVFSGVGKLVLADSTPETGSLTLTGANTHTGGTEVRAGTLNLTNADVLGTGRLTVSGASLTIPTPRLSTAGVTVSGGVLDLSAAGLAVDLTGSVDVTGGELKIGVNEIRTTVFSGTGGTISLDVRSARVSDIGKVISTGVLGDLSGMTLNLVYMDSLEVLPKEMKILSGATTTATVVPQITQTGFPASKGAEPTVTAEVRADGIYLVFESSLVVQRLVWTGGNGDWTLQSFGAQLYEDAKEVEFEDTLATPPVDGSPIVVTTTGYLQPVKFLANNATVGFRFIPSSQGSVSQIALFGDFTKGMAGDLIFESTVEPKGTFSLTNGYMSVARMGNAEGTTATTVYANRLTVATNTVLETTVPAGARQDFRNVAGVGLIRHSGAGTLTVGSAGNDFAGMVLVTNGTFELSATAGGTRGPIPNAQLLVVGANAKLLSSATDASGYTAGRTQPFVISNDAQYVVTARDSLAGPVTLAKARMLFAADAISDERAFDCMGGASFTVSPVEGVTPAVSTLTGSSATVNATSGDRTVNSGVIGLRNTSGTVFTVEAGARLDVFSQLGSSVAGCNNGFTQAGPGRMVVYRPSVTAANSTVRTTAGYLEFRNAGSAGAAQITVGDGTAILLAAETVDQAFPNVFSGSGRVEKSGTKTTVLSGNSASHSGRFSVLGGTLRVSGIFAGNSTNDVTIADEASLVIDQSARVLRSGAVANTNSIVRVAGTLSLYDWNGPNGNLGNLGNTPDRVVLDGGSVLMQGSMESARPFTVTENGAMISVAAGATYTLSPQVTNGVRIYPVVASMARLTVSGAGDTEINTDVTGDPTGTTMTPTGFTLYKDGDGSLTLNGAINATGDTIITNGTIIAKTARALGTGRVTVYPGAMLTLTENEITARQLDLRNASSLRILSTSGLVNRYQLTASTNENAILVGENVDVYLGSDTAVTEGTFENGAFILARPNAVTLGVGASTTLAPTTGGLTSTKGLIVEARLPNATVLVNGDVVALGMKFTGVEQDGAKLPLIVKLRDGASLNANNSDVVIDTAMTLDLSMFSRETCTTALPHAPQLIPVLLGNLGVTTLEEVLAKITLILPTVPEGYQISPVLLSGGLYVAVSVVDDYRSESINVNFYYGTSGTATSYLQDADLAGLYETPGRYWNQFTSTASSATGFGGSALIKATLLKTAVPTSVDLMSDENNKTYLAANSASTKLLRQTITDGGSAGTNLTELTFINIPFSRYRVVVYFAAKDATIEGQAFQPVTIIPGTQDPVTYTAEAGYTREGLGAWGTSGRADSLICGTNFLVSDTFSTQQVKIQTQLPNTNTRATIAAVQILDVSTIYTPPSDYTVTLGSGAQNWDQVDWQVNGESMPWANGIGNNATITLTAQDTTLSIDSNLIAKDIVFNGDATQKLTLTTSLDDFQMLIEKIDCSKLGEVWMDIQIPSENAPTLLFPIGGLAKITKPCSADFTITNNQQLVLMADYTGTVTNDHGNVRYEYPMDVTTAQIYKGGTWSFSEFASTAVLNFYGNLVLKAGDSWRNSGQTYFQAEADDSEEDLTWNLEGGTAGLRLVRLSKLNFPQKVSVIATAGSLEIQTLYMQADLALLSIQGTSEVTMTNFTGVSGSTLTNKKGDIVVDGGTFRCGAISANLAKTRLTLKQGAFIGFKNGTSTTMVPLTTAVFEVPDGAVMKLGSEDGGTVEAFSNTGAGDIEITRGSVWASDALALGTGAKMISVKAGATLGIYVDVQGTTGGTFATLPADQDLTFERGALLNIVTTKSTSWPAGSVFKITEGTITGLEPGAVFVNGAAVVAVVNGAEGSVTIGSHTANTLTWVGADSTTHSGSWANNNSSVLNWATTSGATVGNEYFVFGDSVTFPAFTGVNTVDVTVDGPVPPASMTLAGGAQTAYRFISGTTGAGSITLTSGLTLPANTTIFDVPLAVPNGELTLAQNQTVRLNLIGPDATVFTPAVEASGLAAVSNARIEFVPREGQSQTLSALTGAGGATLVKQGLGSLIFENGATETAGATSGWNANGTLWLQEGTTLIGSTTSAATNKRAGVDFASILVETNATLQLGGRDILTRSQPTLSVQGRVMSYGYNPLPAVELQGGTLYSWGGTSISYPSYDLLGPVTVLESHVGTLAARATGAIYGFALSNGGFIVNSNATLTVGAPLVNGVSHSNTTLTKQGLGTMEINANSTYTGTTVVQAGTLRLNGTLTGGDEARGVPARFIRFTPLAQRVQNVNQAVAVAEFRLYDLQGNVIPWDGATVEDFSGDTTTPGTVNESAGAFVDNIYANSAAGPIGDTAKANNKWWPTKGRGTGFTLEKLAAGEVWIKVALPQQVVLGGYNFANSDYGDRHPTAWRLEVSEDGSVWKEVDERSGAGSATNNGWINNDANTPAYTFATTGSFVSVAAGATFGGSGATDIVDVNGVLETGLNIKWLTMRPGASLKVVEGATTVVARELTVPETGTIAVDISAVTNSPTLKHKVFQWPTGAKPAVTFVLAEGSNPQFELITADDALYLYRRIDYSRTLTSSTVMYDWGDAGWTRDGVSGVTYEETPDAWTRVTLNLNVTASKMLLSRKYTGSEIVFSRSPDVHLASVTFLYDISGITLPTTMDDVVVLDYLPVEPTTDASVTVTYATQPALSSDYQFYRQGTRLLITKSGATLRGSISVAFATTSIPAVRETDGRVGAYPVPGLFWNTTPVNSDRGAMSMVDSLGAPNGSLYYYSASRGSTNGGNYDNTTANGRLTSRFMTEGSNTGAFAIGTDSGTVVLPTPPQGRGWQLRVADITFETYDLYLIFAAGVTPVKYASVGISQDNGNSWTYYGIGGSLKTTGICLGTDANAWEGLPQADNGVLSEGDNYIRIRLSRSDTLDIVQAAHSDTETRGLAAIQIVDGAGSEVIYTRNRLGQWYEANSWTLGETRTTWVDGAAGYPSEAVIPSASASSVTLDAPVRANRVSVRGASDVIIGGTKRLTTSYLDLMGYTGTLRLTAPFDGTIVTFADSKIRLQDAEDATVNYTMIGAGTLVKNNDTTLSLTKPFTLNATINGGTLCLTSDENYENLHSITGSGRLVKRGSGQLGLWGSGMLWLDGGFVVEEGRLHINQATTFDPGAEYRIEAGATLEVRCQGGQYDRFQTGTTFDVIGGTFFHSGYTPDANPRLYNFNLSQGATLNSAVNGVHTEGNQTRGFILRANNVIQDNSTITMTETSLAYFTAGANTALSIENLQVVGGTNSVITCGQSFNVLNALRLGNSKLLVDEGALLTVEAPIRGAQPTSVVEKTGRGRLVMLRDQSNYMPMGFTVTEGVWQQDVAYAPTGSVATVIVSSDATLMGQGALTGTNTTVVISAGGTLQSESSPRCLTIENLALHSGAILKLSTAPNSYVNITKTVELPTGGSVIVRPVGQISGEGAQQILSWPVDAVTAEQAASVTWISPECTAQGCRLEARTTANYHGLYIVSNRDRLLVWNSDQPEGQWWTTTPWTRVNVSPTDPTQGEIVPADFNTGAAIAITDGEITAHLDRSSFAPQQARTDASSILFNIPAGAVSSIEQGFTLEGAGESQTTNVQANLLASSQNIWKRGGGVLNLNVPVGLTALVPLVVQEGTLSVNSGFFDATESDVFYPGGFLSGSASTRTTIYDGATFMVDVPASGSLLLSGEISREPVASAEMARLVKRGVGQLALGSNDGGSTWTEALTGDIRVEAGTLRLGYNLGTGVGADSAIRTTFTVSPGAHLEVATTTALGEQATRWITLEENAQFSASIEGVALEGVVTVEAPNASVTLASSGGGFAVRGDLTFDIPESMTLDYADTLTTYTGATRASQVLKTGMGTLRFSEVQTFGNQLDIRAGLVKLEANLNQEAASATIPNGAWTVQPEAALELSSTTGSSVTMAFATGTGTQPALEVFGALVVGTSASVSHLTMQNNATLVFDTWGKSLAVSSRLTMDGAVTVVLPELPAEEDRLDSYVLLDWSSAASTGYKTFVLQDPENDFVNARYALRVDAATKRLTLERFGGPTVLTWSADEGATQYNWLKGKNWTMNNGVTTNWIETIGSTNVSALLPNLDTMTDDTTNLTFNTQVRAASLRAENNHHDYRITAADARRLLVLTGDLQKTGMGALDINASVQIANGSVTVMEGTLAFERLLLEGGTTTATNLFNGSFYVAPDAQITFAAPTSAQKLAGVISGGGVLVKQGESALIITNRTAEIGSLHVQGGVVEVASGETMITQSPVVVDPGATFIWSQPWNPTNRLNGIDFETTVLGGGAFVWNGGALSNEVATLTQPMTVSSFTKRGHGQLMIDQSDNVLSSSVDLCVELGSGTGVTDALVLGRDVTDTTPLMVRNLSGTGTITVEGSTADKRVLMVTPSVSGRFDGAFYDQGDATLGVTVAIPEGESQPVTDRTSFTLGGTSPATGLLTAKGTVVQVDGSWGGNALAMPNSHLCGLGAIGGDVTINTGAKIFGGSLEEPGRLAIGKSLTLSASSTLRVRVGTDGTVSTVSARSVKLAADSTVVRIEIDNPANLYLPESVILSWDSVAESPNVRATRFELPADIASQYSLKIVNQRQLVLKKIPARQWILLR